VDLTAALGMHEAVEIEPLVASAKGCRKGALGLCARGAHTLLTTGFKPNLISSWAHTSTSGRADAPLGSPSAYGKAFFEGFKMLRGFSLGVGGARDLRGVPELS
jgi:hypothetical protein